MGSAHDIGPAIERAARGGRLDPAAFLEIAETLDAIARLGTALADERRPLLRELGRELHPLPALRSTLARSFDPVGELLDSASPRLGGLRTAVRVAYDRLRRRLDALVQTETASGALQESLVTLRNGRYVIPVKAEARSRVKGIVHDASGSGQTLFVEPLVAVELGNAWREAQAAEREEIERILDELSALVAANGVQLRESLGALARFDLWAAKARLAADMDATRAETADRPEVILLGARHPGLTGRVVPIDVRLGDGYTALVVTGPNTGGKTVTLRTLGLLALMHQAGLHVPAEAGSRLPVFQDVFADIGDEQSVAQSLSTFSGHLRSITRIVEAAGPGHARPARRARRRDGSDRGIGARPGAPRPLRPGRCAHRGDDPLRRAQGLRPHDTGGAQRVGRVRPRHAQPDVPADDRPAGRQPGVRDRRAARAAGGDRGRRPIAVDRDAAHVRGDPGVAQGGRGRDERRARAGPGRRGARARRAPPGPGGARAARRERDELVASARADAERVVAELREEVRATRQALERETVTARSLDAAVEDAEALLAGLPVEAAAPEVEAAPPAGPVIWRLGDRARSRSQGWEGRVAALERGGKRVTLEAGGLRITADPADLEPISGPSRACPATRRWRRSGRASGR